MASDQVYRLVVADGDLPRLRRRKALQGAEVGHLPAPDGRRVVYTTAPIGDHVEDVAGALARDFAAMPDDPRRYRLSAGWAGVVGDLDVEEQATREPWECEGRVGRSLSHVAMVAEELGVLVGRTADMVIVEVMDPPTEQRFKALVRLQRGWHRRAAAA